VIGSSAKWSRFRARLAEAGHTPEAIAMITSPIGVPELVGKEPAVIAVGVATRLIPDLVEGAPKSSARMSPTDSALT
jgi:xanthine/CO dehydrogenase XdhC/CoxF family maturation factor